MPPRSKRHNWDDEHRKRIQEAWINFKENDDQESKSFLILSYLPMVDKHARSVYAKKPATLQYDDLVQAGREGLIDAINKFDLSKKNEFHTYAPMRIKGAILDSVNSLDWTPRSTRENIKAVIKALDKWMESYHSSTDFNSSNPQFIKFIAEETGLDEAKVKETLNSAARTFIYPMHSSAFALKETSSIGSSKKYDNEMSKIIDFITVGETNGLGNETDIENFLNKEELKGFLEQIGNICSVEEKEVLLLIFWEGYTLKKAAETLGKTIGWVSKTRDNAFRKLRKNIEDSDYYFN